MSKQFEILDFYLTEGSDGVLQGIEDGIDIDESDSEIYAELDFLTEEAMRDSLRGIVLESSTPAEDKLRHLEVIENTVFKEEHIANFMNETIQPILEMIGALEPDYLEEADAPVSLDLVTYEVALSLEEAKLRYETEGEASLTEDISDGYVTESTGRVNENLISYLSEGAQDLDLDEDLLAEDYEDDDEDIYVLEEGDLDVAGLRSLFERWSITDESVMAYIIDEAIQYNLAYGTHNLTPSIQQVTELIVESNKIFEIEGSPSILEEWSQIELSEYTATSSRSGGSVTDSKVRGTVWKLQLKLKELRAKLSKAAGAARERIGKMIEAVRKQIIAAKNLAVKGGKRAAALAGKGATRAGNAVSRTGTALGKHKIKAVAKDKAGYVARKAAGAKSYVTGKIGAVKGNEKVGKMRKGLSNAAGNVAKAMKSKAGKVGLAVTGVAAASAAGALAYKKAKGSGKNRGQAADQAIKALRSQSRACKDAKNPEKCRRSIQNKISSWQARKAKA